MSSFVGYHKSYALIGQRAAVTSPIRQDPSVTGVQKAKFSQKAGRHAVEFARWPLDARFTGGYGEEAIDGLGKSSVHGQL